jgi:hypothetical protein
MSELKAWIEELADDKERCIKKQQSFKRWYTKNQERERLRRQLWYKEHSAYWKQRYKDNREQVKEHAKQYYKDNKVEYRERCNAWRASHPEKVKERNSRRLHMGFKPLNRYFMGSVAHHLDDTYVVYIPKEVHGSIYHCLETGVGMEEINKFAMDFIKEKIIELVMK